LGKIEDGFTGEEDIGSGNPAIEVLVKSAVVLGNYWRE